MGTKQIRVGELNFSVVDEGSGAAVLLLHGFPDSSDLWRNQIPALVDAGLRVIVPDLRGFGESDKPLEVEAYALPLILQLLKKMVGRDGIDPPTPEFSVLCRTRFYRAP